MAAGGKTALRIAAASPEVAPAVDGNSYCRVLGQLEKLDELLRHAVAHARSLFSVSDTDGALHGLYISDREVDALIERRNGEIFGSDEAVSTALHELLASSRFDVVDKHSKLTGFDHAVLLLALAPEVDLRYERLYAYLQDDVTKRRPTVDLALSLLCDSARARLECRTRFAPDAPLIHSGILRLLPDPAMIETPLLGQYLRLDERIVRALIGDNTPDSRIAAFCQDAQPAQIADFERDSDIVRRLQAFIADKRNDGRQVRFLFSGAARSGKERTAAAFAQDSGRPLLLADLGHCPAWKREAAAIASLLAREALLSDGLLYISGLHPGAAEEEAARSFIDTLTDQSQDIIIVASESPLLDVILGSDFLNVPFSLPNRDMRHAQWQSFVAQARIVPESDTLAALANNFVLAPEEIAAAVDTAQQQLAWQATRGRLGPDEIARELLGAARRQTGTELAALTSKVSPINNWNDIVLPDEVLGQLKEICTRVTFGHAVLQRGGFGRRLSSGKGITALFAGPSGTGKTMAAEVIANELGLDLFRIDLSRVVSKYIGETEQNLERIFNAAVRSNGVLLFDEADSLLGKRSAVHDAHDRYANLEISYLLQKMEQHEGITILTTNLRGNIDDAFLRRLTFAVQFPFPEEQARLEIWRKIWPRETAVDDDIDFPKLANRFRLSGGNITNAALAAAFFAADKARPVHMNDILRAVQREYAKVGKDLTLVELEDMVR